MDENTPYHVPESFRPGERIKVVKDIREAHAWHELYNELKAPKHLNLMHKVLSEDPIRGFLCKSETAGMHYFPSCALARLTNETVAIEVPSIGGK